MNKKAVEEAKILLEEAKTSDEIVSLLNLVCRESETIGKKEMKVLYPYMKKYKTDPDPLIRLFAIQYICQVRGYCTKEEMLDVFYNEADYDIRARAIGAYCAWFYDETNDIETLEFLISILKDKKEDFFLKSSVYLNLFTVSTLGYNSKIYKNNLNWEIPFEEQVADEDFEFVLEHARKAQSKKKGIFSSLLYFLKK